MTNIINQPYDIDWTLAECTDYRVRPHMEIIMRYIEPRIVRGTYLPCWIWNGRFQYYNRGKENEYAYPSVSIPVNADHSKGLAAVAVHRYMAQTFFGVKPDEIVYRTCKKFNCVSPHHIAVSYRNDPQFNQ